MTRTAAQAIERIRQAGAEASRKAWSALTGQDASESAARRILESARANDRAETLSAAWRKKLEDARTASPYRTPAPRPVAITPAEGRQALEVIEPRVRRTALTESVDAWSAETSRQNDRAYDLGLEVTEPWVAMLDACPRCWDLDGTSVTRPDRFPDDPPLHPHCCCYLATDLVARKAA